MVNPQVIRSKSNQWVSLCQSLQAGGKERKDYFLAEGSKHIKSLLKSYEPLALLTSESFLSELHELDAYLNLLQIIDDRLWPKLSDLDSPVKLMAIFHKPKLSFAALQNPDDLLVLDRIQDPGNLGTLIRTAVASGWHNLVCLKGNADPFSPKVVRASAGALGGLQIYTNVENEELLKFVTQHPELTMINTSSYAAQDVRQLSLSKISKPCLILGNEGAGAHPDLLNYSEALKVSLPILNEQVESLNVGIAGALLMYKLKGLI